jgi:hypothetical protein
MNRGRFRTLIRLRANYGERRPLWIYARRLGTADILLYGVQEGAEGRIVVGMWLTPYDDRTRLGYVVALLEEVARQKGWTFDSEFTTRMCLADLENTLTETKWEVS